MIRKNQETKMMKNNFFEMKNPFSDWCEVGFISFYRLAFLAEAF